MKVSELWLREWVNPNLTPEQLSTRLTMSGFEVEEVTPAAEEFNKVVVGKILKLLKHPEADRLHICQVDIGSSEPLTIVCGAKNVKKDMKVPVALDGGFLPNNKKIGINEIRGILSYGMLCSAIELGLSEQGEGLLQLPNNAPIGANVWEYLKLNDFVFDIAITPNRGDCLSIMGMAKEISAETQSQLHTPNFCEVKPQIDDTLPINVSNPQACPAYVGRIIHNIQADVVTPMWLQERLRRTGIRCISPVVDVMNYVMIELGQPMHAFDLQKISTEIIVRMAKEGEEITLLDGQTKKLTPDTLVIADKIRPLAIAGVMGGLDSSVTLLTQAIFLESAFFSTSAISKMVRQYNLNSESSYRFERGIDPTLQRIAIERATELLLEIVGGTPGPVIEVLDSATLPKPSTITLRKQQIKKILGLTIPDTEIEKILHNLGFTYHAHEASWQVTVPPRRSDITLEIDLIEELIRLYGYDKLPIHSSVTNLALHPLPENRLSLTTLRRLFCDLGFNEVITYTFIDKKIQALFDPDVQPIELTNPITNDMSVMRTNLWPGLVNTLLYNLNRQQNRARLFEVGLRFISNQASTGSLLQEKVISGLITGDTLPDQWGSARRDSDFFDLKGALEMVLKLTLSPDEFIFKPSIHPALHPGQTAEIYRKGKWVGILGCLHPSIIQELDIQNKVFVFELALDQLEMAKVPKATEISKFPEIRRDLAILVDRAVPAQRIQDTIKEVTGELLQDINIFDVYHGKGIDTNCKSIALSMVLQHTSRTLRDEEVADLLERVIVALKDRFAAELRG